MKQLRITLVSDGPTDASLLYPLRWLLLNNGLSLPLDSSWADLRQLPSPPAGLADRIAAAVDLYPCDLLFVHRDAERDPPELRVEEIQRAIQRCSAELFSSRPYICVVPVRMTEAWFLFDEMAIRRAAGNPAGKVTLEMPNVARLENHPEPKSLLLDLLREATELPQRQRQQISLGKSIHRLAELIDDFSPLRRLPAFARLEADVRSVLHAKGWSHSSRANSADN